MTGKTLETSRTSPSYQFGASDKRSPGGFPTLQASLFHNFLKYKGFSLWRDGERLGKGCGWGAGLNVEETTDMTGKTGIDLDVLTWFPPRRCGRNYDISFQYSRLRLTNREWFRGKDHMGSQIPIRQLRRSSVNARPRGATPSGSCRFSRIHKHLGHLPPSLPVLCFEALPPVFERNRGGCIR